MFILGWERRAERVTCDESVQFYILANAPANRVGTMDYRTTPPVDRAQCAPSASCRSGCTARVSMPAGTDGAGPRDAPLDERRE